MLTKLVVSVSNTVCTTTTTDTNGQHNSTTKTILADT